MARDSLYDRLFRALLRLFPFEFRGDFGEQMTADFRDQRRDAGGRPRDVRSLWTRTAVDLLRRAPREHLEVLWRDAVHALRVLRRHPASTATAVLSLAIGVGLNSAVFSLVRGVLWQDLPFAAGDRLVLVGLVDASDDEPSWMSYSGYTAIERQSRMIDPLAAARSRMLTVVEPGEPEYVRCLGVSEEFFAVMGARPIQGRPSWPTTC